MKVNLQEPVKQELRDDGTLSVHSIFHTIQGEGPFAGTPAVFVRLADCNLQCPGCDTEYTSARKMMSVRELTVATFEKAEETNTKLVVLTGGEPFRQNFAEYARRMVYHGWRVQVETNGTLWFDDFFPSRFSVVCSPKTPSLNQQLLRYIKALKYVVKAGEIDPSDGLPTSVLGNGLRPCRPWKGFDGEVFVQPMDEGEDSPDWTPGYIRSANYSNLQAAVEVCLKFGYRLGIQMHKDINLP